MTRRRFFQSLSATAFAIVGLPASRGSTRSAVSGSDPWLAARQIVESGTLGTVIWGQVTAPADGDGDDRELRRVLNVMGLNRQPRQVVRLGSGPRPGGAAGVTTILAIEDGAPVFMAPGPAHEVTIRGTRARLQMSKGQLRVMPSAC